MLRVFFIFISLLLMTLFFSACEQENIVNTVPDNTALNKNPVAKIVQSATGSGHFLLLEEFRTFTFNAKKFGGEVSGHFNLYRHDAGVHVGGSVICLNVQNNIAYFAGLVEVSNLDDDPSFGVGSYVIWSAVDNGEGANYPPDQISLLMGSPGWTQADVEGYCESGVSFGYGYYDIEEGNVQIN